MGEQTSGLSPFPRTGCLPEGITTIVSVPPKHKKIFGAHRGMARLALTGSARARFSRLALFAKKT